MFKHLDVQTPGLKIKQQLVIFTHLKLCATVARHNFEGKNLNKLT